MTAETSMAETTVAPQPQRAVAGGTEAPPGNPDWAGAATGRPPAAQASPFSQTPDFLLGVRLTVSVEVGRVQIPIREVMDLGPGSVIELEHSAAEPVEIFANGRCIGRGEIVVVGEQF